MSEPAIQSFFDALGVPRPIRVVVSSRFTSQPRITVIEKPYAIIGRGSGCDVTLTDPLVSFRHVYLQAFGDRMHCTDLLSPQPIAWEGPATSGWMTPEHRVTVGPYSLQLADDGWAHDYDQWPSPLHCKTRTNETTPFGALPLVHLELLNQQFKGMTWPINRVLTLVGRDDRCRITCTDERISRVHCSLLLSPYGLWVIDLLGRGGIRINGVPQSFALLHDHDQLHVGQYQMRARYESSPKALPPQQSFPASQTDTEELVVPEVVASAEEALPSPEFLTRNNKIFPVTISSPVMIVEPRGGVRSCGYHELQLESNIVTQLLKTRNQLPHLVVDIHHADAMDSIMINAIMAMCRAARGKAVICNASETMLAVLSEMNLMRLWPHFTTREEALQHVCPHPASGE